MEENITIQDIETQDTFNGDSMETLLEGAELIKEGE